MYIYIYTHREIYHIHSSPSYVRQHLAIPLTGAFCWAPACYNSQIKESLSDDHPKASPCCGMNLAGDRLTMFFFLFRGLRPGAQGLDQVIEMVTWGWFNGLV